MNSKAREVTESCINDPRVGIHAVSTTLYTVIAEKFEEYIDALRWCSGAPNFAPGGQACKGWKRIVKPLI